ncbi:oxalate:formate antiporter [Echinococcus granulosus]|uniref:Oxalate:formate antiporter n=1 Tax=Echinococcus granulosus TaxID=6210 RepID=W6U107_ECHGR|nr:oxalate:formate antiporter [Echinococcus granulosus]EUB54151.1 oxalate:formate antiporter [Echinococcus granulosus]
MGSSDRSHIQFWWNSTVSTKRLQRFWSVYFDYCILFGIGLGLPYSVIFSIASSWFPHKRATVVGIISAGFGLGALVFIPIQTRIINPDNLHTVNGTFPREVIERVPKAFLVLGGIVLGLEVVATILLQQKPEAKSDDLSTES